MEAGNTTTGTGRYSPIFSFNITFYFLGSRRAPSMIFAAGKECTLNIIIRAAYSLVFPLISLDLVDQIFYEEEGWSGPFPSFSQ